MKEPPNKYDAWHSELALWLSGQASMTRLESLILRLQALIDCRCTMVLAFPGFGQASIITETTSPGSPILETNPQYLEGAYLLDPFYNFGVSEKRSGAYRIRDVAPTGFEKSEYYQVFYQRACVVDEICILCALPRDFILISCARIEDDAPFSHEDASLLHSLSPVIEACLKRWWETYTLSPTDDQFHQQVVLAFDLFGSSILTPREVEILQCMLRGHSIKSLADHFHISIDTVKHHRKNIYNKLEIRSQGELFDLFLTAVSAYKPELYSDPLQALSATR